MQVRAIDVGTMKTLVRALIPMLCLSILAACPSFIVDPAAQEKDFEFAAAWGFETLGRSAKFFDCAVQGSSLYAVDLEYDALLKFDLDGNLEWIKENLAEPSRIAIGPMGDIFLIERTHIVKFDSSGNWLEWTAEGGGYFEDVAVDADGNVYGAATIGEHVVRKFDSSGTLLAEWGASGVGSQMEPEFAYGPHGIAVDAEYVYVLDYDIRTSSATGRMYDHDGTYKSGLGPVLNSINGGIAVDGSGNIFLTSKDSVSEYGPDETHRFSYNHKRTWGHLSPGAGVNEFCGAYGAALDATGALYIAEYENMRIQKFDADGEYEAQFVHCYREPASDGFKYPAGLALDKDGNLLVADTGNNRVMKYGSGGNLLPWSTAQDVKLYAPSDVAVGADGAVYILDSNRVQKLDADGNLLLGWGSYGFNYGEPGRYLFMDPRSIAIGTGGRIVVTNPGASDIRMFDADGVFIDLFEAITSETSKPWGVAADGAGRVFFTMAYGTPILGYDEGGTLLGSWGIQGTGAGAFREPRGMAFDAKGRLYIVDRGNSRVQVMDSTTGAFLTSFGGYGTGDGQFRFPEDIAIGEDGSLYVSDTYSHRIQKFIIRL
jgi:tripartite motif-containing protein 71